MSGRLAAGSAGMSDKTEINKAGRRGIHTHRMKKKLPGNRKRYAYIYGSMVEEAHRKQETL
jgi:hypothetical protein